MSKRKFKVLPIAENGTQSSVLTAVRDYPSISRTQIVEITGLTHAATSKAVSRLLKKGILREEPYADTTGPRRKKGLNLNPDTGFCIAIEYEPRGLEAAAVDTSYRKFAQHNVSMNFKQLDRDEKIKVLVKFITNFLKNIDKPASDCLGIALIDPGIIDSENGISICCSLLNDWQNVDITRIIEDKFKLPVVLTNTSMAKIRAIDRIEIKGAVENIIFIEYGDGIGCGLKLAGNYVPGSSSISGELGHMRVTDEQIICRCGKVGCLEAVSALPALESKAKAIIREETETLLNGQSEISGICIFEAAAKGDRLCTHIVEEAFEYLARAIANLINVINPEIIVLESLISKVGENAYSHLLRAIEKNTLSTHWQSLEVKFSGIEQYLGPLGGASTILDLCIERSL